MVRTVLVCRLVDGRCDGCWIFLKNQRFTHQLYVDQAKSTSYFIQLRSTSDFDLIRPAGSNRLIVDSKTV